MFVSDSIQQNGNSDEGVAAICYPRHTLAPTLTLLLHQLRQTLPQLLLLAADTNLSSTNGQRDSFRSVRFSSSTLTQPIPAFHSWWSYTEPAGAKNKRGILHFFPSPVKCGDKCVGRSRQCWGRGGTFKRSLGKSLPLLRPSRLLMNCWQDIFFPMFWGGKQKKKSSDQLWTNVTTSVVGFLLINV